MFSYNLTSFSQSKFVWDITDSTTKTKNEIYSYIKLFVGTYWKSANTVVQNDDKEGGNIILKGSIQKKVKFFMVYYTYDYDYTIIFKFKDNKYKITINNVYCSNARASTRDGYTEKIEPFEGDNCPETGTFRHPGPSEDEIIPMMDSLRKDLNSIVVDFINSMKQAETKKDDW